MAYDSTRYSVRPSPETKAGQDLAKKFAEEDKALGGIEAE